MLAQHTVLGLPLGPWSEWTGAAATVGAVVFALYQVRSERRSVRRSQLMTEEALAVAHASLALERGRRADELERARRWQADVIGVSYAFEPTEMMVGLDGFVRIDNGSSAPIYDCHCHIVTDALTSTIPQPPSTVLAHQSFSWDLVAPPRDLRQRDLCVSYRDNSGERWVKWADGYLDLDPVGTSPHLLRAARVPDPPR